MATSSYVIFQLHGALYGIAADAVVEIFSLPALVPIAEAPSYIAGVLDVRGRVVPVLDLDLRLGRAPHAPSIGDRIILFTFAGHHFGAIVDDVLELLAVDDDELRDVPEYGCQIEEGAVRFISGVATTDDGIVALIDVERLLRSSDAIEELEEHDIAAYPAGDLDFAPGLGEDARAIFRARADALRVDLIREAEEELAGFTVFRLGDEHFAVDVGSVQELTTIGDITPVPCTPENIIGQINLRGEIVTLVDVRAALGLGLPGLGAGSAMGSTGIVTTHDRSAAIAVDAIDDVIHVRAGDVQPAPSAADAGSKAYVTGVLRRGGRTVSILDLARMFRAGEFDVDEEVV